MVDVDRSAIASLPESERVQLSWSHMPRHSDISAKVRAAVWSGEQDEPPGAIEIVLAEGDVCIFDLMTLHSASTMQHVGESRVSCELLNVSLLPTDRLSSDSTCGVLCAVRAFLYLF